MTVLFLAFTVAGLFGAMAPGFLASVNSAGIPRWNPTLSALLCGLASAAIRLRSDDMVFRLLATTYGVYAACFARPGARELDLGYPNFEPLLVILVVVLAVAALKLPESWAIRFALACSAGLPLVVYGSVLLLIPLPELDASLYVTVALTIILGVAVTLRSTRQRRTPH